MLTNVLYREENEKIKHARLFSPSYFWRLFPIERISERSQTQKKKYGSEVYLNNGSQHNVYHLSRHVIQGWMVRLQISFILIRTFFPVVICFIHFCAQFYIQIQYYLNQVYCLNIQ